jgi:hypothetical protein
MAHFAQMNDNNIVISVIVVNNSDIDDLPYPASEPVGQAYIASIGLTGDWLQTSYNCSFRGMMAGINGCYDPVEDVFKATDKNLYPGTPVE